MTPEALGQEIRELHAFFVGWLTGALPASRLSFARFTAAMAPEFRIGHPDGTEEGLAALTDRLRRAHGARASQRPPFEIAILSLQVRWVEPERALAAYIERQLLADRWTARRSLAAFRADPKAPCGVLWTDLQECWIAP